MPQRIMWQIGNATVPDYPAYWQHDGDDMALILDKHFNEPYVIVLYIPTQSHMVR